MVLVQIDNSHNLQRRLLQSHLHGFDNLYPLCIHASVSNFPVSLPLLIEDSPASVLGVANVISNRHISQHTSSSALAPPVNHPKPPPFRLFFSKNCTAIWPLTLLFGEVADDSCRISWPMRVSIRVTSSGSATKGRVRSRTSSVDGRMVGK